MGKRKAPETAATPSGGQVVDPDFPVPTHRGNKRKVSFTIDESLLDEVRELAGGRPLSGVVNELLTTAVAQRRLNELADEMIAEAGEPPPEAYEHVLSQWFGDADE